MSSACILYANQFKLIVTEAFPCGKVPLLQGGGAAMKDDVRSRVVGGVECPKGHCPWQVTITESTCSRSYCTLPSNICLCDCVCVCVDGQVLLKYGQKGFCGGVIYKPTWILTAAHCLEKLNVKFLKIVAGTVTSGTGCE